jgi:hypothetical protein
VFRGSPFWGVFFLWKCGQLLSSFSFLPPVERSAGLCSEPLFGRPAIPEIPYITKRTSSTGGSPPTVSTFLTHTAHRG